MKEFGDRLRTIAIAAIAVVLFCSPASAGLLQKLKDPETGKLDATEFLLSGGGFAPIPIVITEPAVGFGFGVAPAFFHDFNHRGMNKGELTLEQKLEYPPSASAAIGAYTTNGSWIAGGAHIGSYRKDTIRYTGVVAYADLNLKFYVLDEPLEFGIKGAFTYQDVKFRLGKSAWFMGAEYSLASSDVDFKLPANTLPPGSLRM